MIKLRFGKLPSHKTFNYLPRYYDPAKEELEKKLGMFKKSDDEELRKERILHGLRTRSGSTQSQVRDKYTSSSNRRLIIILVALFMLTFVLLTSDRIMNLIIQISK